MTEYHELTEKIWGRFNLDVVNQIVKEYLSEKSEEIKTGINMIAPNQTVVPDVESILGLHKGTESKEEIQPHECMFSNVTGLCGTCNRPHPSSQPQPEQGKWCEHIKWQQYGKSSSGYPGGYWGYIVGYPQNICDNKSVGSWKQCPICGTPRPQQQSFRDRLEIAIGDNNTVNACNEVLQLFKEEIEKIKCAYEESDKDCECSYCSIKRQLLISLKD